MLLARAGRPERSRIAFLRQGEAMYVYLLRSASHRDQRYVGLTGDLRKGLSDHNAGRSPHTSKHIPWELVVAVYFRDQNKAESFERYLKQGSGHAFASRHFW